MPKEMDILPDFAPGELSLKSIPLFQYSKTLKDELSSGYPAEEALFHYELMLLVRHFENLIVEMKAQKFEPKAGFKFTGATHLSLGQEAVAVGAIGAIGPQDYITSTHRGHGHSIVKTALALRAKSEDELETLLAQAFSPGPRTFEGQSIGEQALNMHLFRTMAELFGKQEGYCAGRGGGMHIADFDTGHLGANAIVGGSYALATGAAVGANLLGRDRIVLCLMGDGATNNGICHEAYNFSTMGQFENGVPIIYLIENNQYGMTGQQAGEVTGVRYLAQRAAGYNDCSMHAEVVDGMDPLAVRDAVGRAAGLCRTGSGPVVVECQTYRWMGHSLSDQRAAYRSRREEEAWQQKDPLETFAGRLIEAGLVDEPGLQRMDSLARGRIENAACLAAEATDPAPSAIYEGLFSNTSCDRVLPPWDRVNLLSKPRRYARDQEGRILGRHAVAEALTEEMTRDSRVVLYGEDVADYGGAFQATFGLLRAFGRHRVFNAPISEACIAGSAVGMAMVGLRPVAEIMYIDFMFLAMDQVGNQAAKARYMFGGKAMIPMVIRTTVGGGKGYAGQHSQSLEALLTQVPGLKVVMPSNAYDTKGLLKSAIRDNDPVIFIEHQHLYTEKGRVPEEEYLVPLGKAKVVREGTDVTLVAYSYLLGAALQAAESASSEGISVEVVDPRTLVPLDEETIFSSVRKTGHLVCACQAPRTGCFAEHIAFRVQCQCFSDLKSPIEIVAAHDVPPPMATTLEAENLPSRESILQGIKKVVDYG
ncbi:MAG: dehydrogenase E1 component subunit alpha/beta [Gemmatimonadota bacterium]|nr:dehydrogenase E1 component subunit alpha/beta [Gemmatimonadota bacterium]